MLYLCVFICSSQQHDESHSMDNKTETQRVLSDLSKCQSWDLNPGRQRLSRALLLSHEAVPC